MCLTSNEELAKKMRLLRDHGMSRERRYWHEAVGFNYRMTNLQAAIGVAQLSKLDEFVEKKRLIAEWYREGLGGLADKDLISLHPEMKWAKCIYWMYSILIQDSFGLSRNELMDRLQLEGIETRPLLAPLHLMPPYKKGDKPTVAEELSGRGVNLPSSVNLTAEQIDCIVDIIVKGKV